MISFGTPRAIVINLSAIFALLAALPTEFLRYSPVKCVFKNVILPFIYAGRCPATGIFTGCECPACGLTRAMSRLLHGDLAGAWAYNRLVFIVFVLMAVVLVVNLYRLPFIRRLTSRPTFRS